MTNVFTKTDIQNKRHVISPQQKKRLRPAVQPYTGLGDQKTSLFEKDVSLSKRKIACGCLFSRKRGLGTPKHAFSKQVHLQQKKKKPAVACSAVNN